MAVDTSVKSVTALALKFDAQWNAYVRENTDLADKEKDKLNRIDNFDYALDYVQTYEITLSSLEEVFDDWASLQDKTKGLDFYISKYIEKLTYEKCPKGAIEEYVLKNVKEAKAAIKEVSLATSIDAEVEPQKRFAQALANFRYLTANARKLLDDAGIPQRLHAEARELTAKKYEEYHKKATLERTHTVLECSNEIEMMKKSLQEQLELQQHIFIDSSASQKSFGNKILVGFRIEELTEEAKGLVEYFGIPTSVFSTNPIYFDPENNRNKALIIKASENYLDDKNKAGQLVEELFFSFISSYGSSNVKLFGLESIQDIVVRLLGDSLKNNVDQRKIYGGKIETIPSNFGSHLNQIYEERKRRDSSYYTSANVNSFFEFNRKNPDSKETAIVSIINNFPHGFIGRDNRFDAYSFKTFMNEAARCGIFPILLVDKNFQYDEKECPCLFDIDATDVHADVIEIYQDHITFNGEPADLNILSSGFDRNKFYENLKRAEDNGDNISLTELIESDEMWRNKNNYNSSILEGIRVPIGKEKGKLFAINIKSGDTSQSAFVLGSSGRGKSSFIHTFIMSTAYFYSPEEVQFYLVDFKSETNKGVSEFSAYRQDRQDDEYSMYVPHVRYMSLSNTEDAGDELIRKINTEKNRRANLSNDINKYNKDAISNGKKKMPILFVVIDECNKLLGTEETASSSKLAKTNEKLSQLLATIRSYGIGLIFSGQEFSRLISSSLHNIKTRVCFDFEKDGNTNLFPMFKPTQERERIRQNELSKIGHAVFSTEEGRNPHFAKNAYGGKPGQSKELADLARKIREKWKDNEESSFLQVLTGERGFFPIEKSEELDEGSIDYDNERESVKRTNERYKTFLPIGASVATMLRMSMCFGDKNGTNYALVADEEKIANIERNMAFSYMDKKISTLPNAKMLYLGKKSVFFDGDYEDVRNIVTKYVTFVPQTRDIAIEILKLFDLMIERDEERERNDTQYFDPVYVIVHDFTFLTNIALRNDWVNPVIEKEEKVNQVSDSETEKELKQLEETLRNNLKIKGREMSDFQINVAIRERFTQLHGMTPEQAKEKEMSGGATASERKEGKYVNDVLSKDMVNRAFVNLYARGSSFGIYLLISDSNPELIREKIDQASSQAKTKNTINYLIFDSYDAKANFDSRREESRNKSEDPSVAYLVRESALVRLFDYSPLRASEWWKKFE